MDKSFVIKFKHVLLLGIILLIILSIIFILFGNKIDNTSSKLDQQISLTNALQDTLKKTNNFLNEEKASKLTLQASLDKLEHQNLNLNDNQKELVRRIRKIQSENSIISAALVRTEARLDSALNWVEGKVNLEDSSLLFSQVSDSISFNIQINNALPSKKSIMPTLSVNSLVIPNKQFIEFHFEDKNKYHQRPVSFSISNSNPLITTTQMDSYTIPEVNQEAIKPTGWQKVKHFLGERKKELIIGSIAGSIGFLIGAN